MNLTEVNKYGYYTGGPFNRPTRSKIEAIEWCSPHKTWPTWYFHDSEFSKYDWKTEPPASLESLYHERARFLRARYDYIIVQYSGGVDSHNMLMSFLSQGIMPDEVAFFYYQFCETDNVMGLEWRLQTQPKLAKLKQKYPGLKIRKIDLTPHAINYIKTVDDYEIYRMLGRYSVRINPGIRCHLSDLEPDYRAIKEQGKSIRILLGIDKPRLRFKDGKFIFNFYDIINDENVETAEYNHHEWFYWHPDAAKILIKQAHVAKKYWTLYKNNWHEMRCKVRNPLGWVLDHNNDDVSQLIYPWHGKDWYLPMTVTKAWEGMIGSRDYEFLTARIDTTEKYLKSSQAVIQSIDPMYFNNGDPNQGLISSVSKDYAID